MIVIKHRRIFLTLAIFQVLTLCNIVDSQDSSVDKFTFNLPKIWTVETFRVSDPGTSTKYNATYTDVSVEGLDDVSLHSLSFDLRWHHVEALINVPKLNIHGRHKTRGSYLFIPFRGNGLFNVKAVDSTIKIIAALDRIGDNLQAKNAVAEIHAENTRLDFEDLYTTHGGSPTLDDMGRLLRKQINAIFFNLMKFELAGKLTPLLLDQLNANLPKVPSAILHDKVTPKLDLLLNRTREQFKASQLDPMKLEDMVKDFGLGHISLTNRSLYGLSSIFRSSHALAHYNWKEETVVLETTLNFEKITLETNFDLFVIGIKPKGVTNSTVTSLLSTLKIEQPLKHDSQARLLSFEINHIDKVHVDLKGLGFWTGPVEAIMNALSIAFKSEMSKIASGPIRDIFTTQIGEMHFFQHK